ncbi:DJ-1/PfpI family protein [Vibrio sp. LaRot3]|uniref:DJ-1/PfpI family protein n=1 Tax=Vibrio sp. LaRot3 TaxID=2998829 RepID=UPI0022CE322E|nr:DJ-1/PfpI family protein [Vibrio sp. LaRot3]MDA0150483.1 DJ-1/PfpI family protein [Vibrio sp. LaRot3]
MIRTVHIAVYPTLADWEIGLLSAHINSSQFQRGEEQFQIVTVAKSLAPIRTKGGMTILPDISLEQLDVKHSAILILPGADNSHEIDVFAPKTFEYKKAKIPMAAICGATAMLARNGLLNDVEHTSNMKAFLEGKSYQGAHLYRDVPAVSDGNIITASGLAPVEFSVEVFRQLEVYSEMALSAWFDLFKHQDASAFFRFMEGCKSE